MMSYLDELNEAQRRAVEHINGPLLVIAGPGSGKTRVLTYRIAHLMQQGVDPFHILALTFTNKASREMKHRIEKITGPEAKNLWMGTFHSVFARILRIDGKKLGYPSNYSIYDTQDSRNLIRNIIKEMGLNTSLYKASVVHNRISAAKNSLINAGHYVQTPELITEDEASGRPRIGEIFLEYSKRCFQSGAMDFDDLLLKMYELLDNFPEALYKYQQKFRYILIDEFQDTNRAQYAIVKMLADVYQNICVVGDDAQSIYAFRGANLENILHFEKDFPDLSIYKLEQNYRSTKYIVEAANKLITHNKRQLVKTIWTENEAGQKIRVFRTMSDNDEGRAVADSIMEEKLRNHYHNDDFAILYRTNAQSRAFEDALRRANIRYQVYGGVAFYQRKEIKDALAYMRLVVNPDDEEALRRVINYPARGIGKTTMEKVTVLAHEQDVSLWKILKRIGEYSFNSRARGQVEAFVTMIKSFQAQLDKKDAWELAEHIVQDTGLRAELKKDNTIEGLGRLDNLNELLNSIKEFTVPPEFDDEGNPLPQADTGLGAYLQQISLLTDQDQDEVEDTVKLMTIHAAKGLEFPVVYIAGLEENLFPSILSIASRDDLEEERRLFYVAITRAKQKLYLSYAATRFRFGDLLYCEPSRFLEELPEEVLEMPITRASQKDKPSPAPSRSGTTKVMPASTRTYTHQPSPDFTAANPEALQAGMEVEHQKFGFGKIVSIEGNGQNRIANIFFHDVGTKRIMLKFARLHIVNRKAMD